jgi:DNA-binding transcriptional ArsR family regulator
VRDTLDRIFQALADPARREILDRLTRRPASVSEPARPLPMSMPAVYQHRAAAAGAGLKRARPVWTRSTLGLKKVDGDWKIMHEHNSAPLYMDGSGRAALDLQP